MKWKKKGKIRKILRILSSLLNYIIVIKIFIFHTIISHSDRTKTERKMCEYFLCIFLNENLHHQYHLNSHLPWFFNENLSFFLLVCRWDVLMIFPIFFLQIFHLLIINWKCIPKFFLFFFLFLPFRFIFSKRFSKLLMNSFHFLFFYFISYAVLF